MKWIAWSFLSACGYPQPSLPVDGDNDADHRCGFRDIAVGSDFTCAIDAAGGVWCWGQNDRGQVALGGPNPALGATRIALPSPAIEVKLGKFSACARLDDGTVWCWGDNATGALGDGTTSGNGPTQVQLGGDRAVELGVGAHHACIRRQSDLAIECWGDNHFFALGNTGATLQPTPQVVPGTAGSTQLSVGHRDVCFLDAQGKPTCWGRNDNGELATADGTRAGGEPMTGITTASRVAATGGFSCVIDAGGAVRCSGRNEGGQLGDGTFSNSAAPSAVVVGNAVDLRIGVEAGWALRGDGTLVGWGQGALDGAFDTRRTANVSALAGVTRMDFGYGHACAIAGGQPVCWGHNLMGNLGRGTRSYADTPIAVTLPGVVDSVTIGLFDDVCARVAGKLYCWGRDDLGELGDGSSRASAAPLLVATSLPAPAAGVATNWQHVCAWDTGGSVSCWGWNIAGQVGSGMTGRTSSPVVVAVTGATQVVTGYAHSCALAGTVVKCWGDNGYGELGTGTNTPSSTPVAVTVLTSPTAITSSTAATMCAIANGGTVYCWGQNDLGQVGDGSTMNRNAPVLVTLPAAATRVVLGAAHACALLVGGDVYCWGLNADGQLGQGDKTSRSTPTRVAGVTASDLFGGSNGTCARIAATSKVQCWGTTILTSSLAPLDVPALDDADAIAITAGGGCVIRAGQLSCWGEKLFLGDGDTSDWQALPVTLTCGGS